MRGGEADSSGTAGRQRLTRLNREKVDLEDMVSFSAKDSLVLFGQNNAYLYGDGTVEYSDLQLNSGEIRMVLDSSTVYAAGIYDSVAHY